jgi:hypothetical protein
MAETKKVKSPQDFMGELLVAATSDASCREYHMGR